MTRPRGQMANARHDSQRSLRARIQRKDKQLRSELRLRSFRRFPPAYARRRLSARQDPRVKAHCRSHRARTHVTRPRPALQHEKGTDGLPPGEGVFSPAASGWSARSSCMGATPMPEGSSNAFSRWATTLACSPRNTTSAQAPGRQFPPGLSHIALVNAAFDLAGFDARQPSSDPKRIPLAARISAMED